MSWKGKFAGVKLKSKFKKRPFICFWPTLTDGDREGEGEAKWEGKGEGEEQLSDVQLAGAKASTNQELADMKDALAHNGEQLRGAERRLLDTKRRLADGSKELYRKDAHLEFVEKELADMRLKLADTHPENQMVIGKARMEELEKVWKIRVTMERKLVHNLVEYAKISQRQRLTAREEIKFPDVFMDRIFIDGFQDAHARFLYHCYRLHVTMEVALGVSDLTALFAILDREGGRIWR